MITKLFEYLPFLLEVDDDFVVSFLGDLAEK